MITYFKVVCKVSVQKIQEIPPKTISDVIAYCPKIAFITYNGEVPISPKIIPNVTNKPAVDNLL